MTNKRFYIFTNAADANRAHEAIDDARCGGSDKHFKIEKGVHVAERHVELVRDQDHGPPRWLVGVSNFTESQRVSYDQDDNEIPGPLAAVLPDPPEEIDFAERTTKRINPRRTDVLTARRG